MNSLLLPKWGRGTGIHIYMPYTPRRKVRNERAALQAFICEAAARDLPLSMGGRALIANFFFFFFFFFIAGEMRRLGYRSTTVHEKGCCCFFSFRARCTYARELLSWMINGRA